ncbi:hypothetical protein AX14_009576 [Amanita brunnescens Koide BX004]|nr:hypothetical protein AX14_009576 [Amanita brunnescens Koide BX004]
MRQASGATFAIRPLSSHCPFLASAAHHYYALLQMCRRFCQLLGLRSDNRLLWHVLTAHVVRGFIRLGAAAYQQNAHCMLFQQISHQNTDRRKHRREKPESLLQSLRTFTTAVMMENSHVL